jgi:hypothetical protein
MASFLSGTKSSAGAKSSKIFPEYGASWGSWRTTNHTSIVAGTCHPQRSAQRGSPTAGLGLAFATYHLSAKFGGSHRIIP